MDRFVTILSLVVAALAVFVGPLVSWAIARRQLEGSQRIASRQLVGPMRQAWIVELRRKLAELLSSALHYFVAGFEDRTDQEYRRLTELEQEVVLMVNSHEQDHEALIATVRKMVSALDGGKELDKQFIDAHHETVAIAQRILKAEWNRVKEGT